MYLPFDTEKFPLTSNSDSSIGLHWLYDCGLCMSCAPLADTRPAAYTQPSDASFSVYLMSLSSSPGSVQANCSVVSAAPQFLQLQGLQEVPSTPVTLTQHMDCNLDHFTCDLKRWENHRIPTNENCSDVSDTISLRAVLTLAIALAPGHKMYPSP